MKRGMSFLLAVLLTVFSVITGLGNITVGAEAAEQAQDSISFANAVDFSCRFDAATFKIQLGGQISHDVFITHRDYSLEVYAIPPGADAETVILDPNCAPVVGASVAIHFEFAIDAKESQAKYSRYSVVLRSPDGENLIASEPKFAEVEASISANVGARTAYKGISGTQLNRTPDLGAGRVLIPVYIDRLISPNANGYVYRAGTENLYFDKACVESLDTSIRAATVSGAEVYLQYLFSEADPRMIPNVYDMGVLTKIESVTAFLTDRFDGTQGGRIDGLIVGREIDRALAGGAIDAETLETYAEQYALYVIAVANTARRKDPTIDIVLPFSETNSYSDSDELASAPAALLEKLLTIFDAGFSAPFSVTTMIETHTTPLTFPEGWELYDAPLEPLSNDSVLHAANVECYADYLSRLQARYDSAPKTFMLVWQVEDGLAENALAASYAYSYFRLLGESSLSSFVISMTDREQKGITQGFSEISHLFTYIDTAESLTVTETLLSYFHAKSWASLQHKTYGGSYALRTLYHAPTSRALITGIKGSFSYFDFSTSVNLNTWFCGASCEAIRLSYHAEAGKALQMEMENEGGYAEAFCLYEYPENLAFTPYVSFRVLLDAHESENAPTLYEVMLTSGTGRSQIVGRTAIAADRLETVTVDLSAYTAESLSDYWRISVRPLDGESESYSLWICDVVGYSTQMTSQELEDAIQNERLRIRNLENPSDGDEGGYENLLRMLGIVAVVLMVGVGVFILLRQNDDKRREGDQNDS